MAFKRKWIFIILEYFTTYYLQLLLDEILTFFIRHTFLKSYVQGSLKHVSMIVSHENVLVQRLLNNIKRKYLRETSQVWIIKRFAVENCQYCIFHYSSTSNVSVIEAYVSAARGNHQCILESLDYANAPYAGRVRSIWTFTVQTVCLSTSFFPTDRFCRREKEDRKIRRGVTWKNSLRSHRWNYELQFLSTPARLFLLFPLERFQAITNNVIESRSWDTTGEQEALFPFYSSKGLLLRSFFFSFPSFLFVYLIGNDHRIFDGNSNSTLPPRGKNDSDASV